MITGTADIDSERTRSRWIAAGFVLAAGVGTVVCFLVPRSTAKIWTTEPGPLHYATVFLMVLVAILYGIRTRRHAAAAGAVGLFLMALIKLDPGSWLLTEKADFLTFFRSPEIPILHRVVTGTVFAATAILVGIATAAGWKRFWRALRGERTPAVLVALAAVLLAAAQVLDRIQGAMTWPRPGWHTHPQIYFGVGAGEAVLEFLVSVALLGAFFLSRRQDLPGS